MANSREISQSVFGSYPGSLFGHYCCRSFKTFSCLLVLLGSFAFAQSSNTSLSGVVKDPAGSVIADATAILTNAATSTTRSQKTSMEGRYSFDLLTPGDYKLEVQATGFRKQMLQNIHVLIAKASTIDVTMQVGAITEEVTVNAESSQVM